MNKTTYQIDPFPSARTRLVSSSGCRALYPAWQPIAGATTVSLISSFSCYRSWPPSRPYLVPLFIHAADIEFSRRHYHCYLHFKHDQLLPYAISWPKLKRPPRAFNGVQGVARLSEPAVRNKRIGGRPVSWVALNCFMT